MHHSFLRHRMRARDKAEGTPPIDRIVKVCYSAINAQNVIIVFKQEHPEMAWVEKNI